MKTTKDVQEPSQEQMRSLFNTQESMKSSGRTLGEAFQGFLDVIASNQKAVHEEASAYLDTQLEEDGETTSRYSICTQTVHMGTQTESQEVWAYIVADVPDAALPDPEADIYESHPQIAPYIKTANDIALAITSVTNEVVTETSVDVIRDMTHTPPRISATHPDGTELSPEHKLVIAQLLNYGAEILKNVH